MNNMDYNDIIQYFTENSIILILLGVLFLIFVVYLISKTLRKSGLFLLLLTFMVDKLIRALPIDLYDTYPNLSFIIMISYFLGIFVFLVKIFKKIFKKNKNKELLENNDRSKLSKFFKFTGSLPLLVMLFVNLLNIYLNIFSKALISNLTSISFLFMAFISLINTYKYIDKKDIGDDFDKLNFRDLRKKFKNEDEAESASNNNEGRRILRKTVKANSEAEKVYSETRKLKEKLENNLLDEYSYDIDDRINKVTEDVSNTDLLSLVTNISNFTVNKTVLSIKNLVDGSSFAHTSRNCKAKVIEDVEYKVDLEFENYNDYDYGKFIDILIAYSKDKESYKLILELIPYENHQSKIVFYDPSDIFDSVKDFEGSFQGKNISMNFPKYKINFVTRN